MYYKNAEHSTLRIESIYDVINECECPVHQQSDSDLCIQLGISSIDELPLIK